MRLFKLNKTLINDIPDIMNFLRIASLNKKSLKKKIVNRINNNKGNYEKQRTTALFIVTAESFFYVWANCYWRSKVRRCFKSANNQQSSKTDDTFKIKKGGWKVIIILSRFDHKMKHGKCRVILFSGNAIYHNEKLQKDLTNIKLLFLLTTRHLGYTFSM